MTEFLSVVKRNLQINLYSDFYFIACVRQLQIFTKISTRVKHLDENIN